MTGNRPSSDCDLLSLCAILRWFDDDLLRALAGGDEDAIGALLASELVVSVAEPAGAFHLREDVRADVLAGLRAERPSDELTLHQRVFGHFLRRMQEPTSDIRHGTDENSVLYYLEKLFSFIAERQEW